ncbi:MAG: hypothetical protein QXW97_02030 [Candidatus Pacearchaeota archaeon]
MKEQRIKFKKGKQRIFLKLAMKNLNIKSLKQILQFGFNIKYSTLKNYYSERRLIPKSFFLDLCHIANIKKRNLKFEYVSNNWGQIKGGKSKNKKIKFYHKLNKIMN